jgi:hypothetical protein
MANNCTDPPAPDFYGWLDTENKYFRIVACYQEVAAGCLHWGPVYCTSLLIYCVLAVVNLILLYHVLRYYRKSQLEGEFLKRPKAWILMLSMAIFVIEFVRNFVGDIMPW